MNSWHAITGLGVLVGVILRWVGLSRQSLWFDEGHSAWMASLTMTEMMQALSNDVGAPLYLTLLRGWQSIFGTSELAMRSLSAAAASAALVLFVPLARRLLASPPAVAAAVWLAAVSVVQIQYARDARYYALLSLEAVIALNALLIYLDNRRPRWLVIFAFAIAAMLYTHNAAMYYLLAINLLWLILARPLRWRPIVLTNLAIAALYLPWLPMLLEQTRWAQGRFWASPPTLDDVLRTVSYIAGGQVYHLSPMLHAIAIGPVRDAAQIAWVISIVVLALAAIAVSGPNRRQSLALAVFTFAPVLLVVVHSYVSQPVFMERLFVASSLSLPLMAVMASLGRQRKLAISLIALMTIWSIASAVGFELWEKKENWRAAEAYVATLPSEGTLLVFVANEGQLPFDYYARRNGRLMQYDRTGLPIGFFEKDPPEPVLRVLSDADVAHLERIMASGQYDRIVLIYSHEWFSDPDRRAERLLTGQWLGSDLQDFHDITIQVFTPRSGVADRSL
jgi:mannosyltransferase